MITTISPVNIHHHMITFLKDGTKNFIISGLTEPMC